MTGTALAAAPLGEPNGIALQPGGRKLPADVPDNLLLDAIAYVDSLPERGEADQLIDHLRPRLRRLRPQRRIRFARLLAMPLEPAIVPTRAWRPGKPAMPRAILPLFASITTRVYPDCAEAAEAILMDAALPLQERISRAGALAWPEAGAVLAKAEPAADWRQAGLPEADCLALVRAAGTVLSRAVLLHDLTDPAAPTADVDAALAQILSATQLAGAMTWGVMLTILLHQFPQANAPIVAADTTIQSGTKLAAAASAALEAAWRWIEGADAMMPDEPVAAAAAVRRQVALLKRLSMEPGRKRRGTEVAGRLAVACRAAMAEAARYRFCDRLAQLTESPDSRAMEAIEDDARGIRQFDIEVRRLGEHAGTADALKDAAQAVAQCRALHAMDQARLAEILLGAKAALALLREAAAGK
jgi:hypothetical protein